jgi:hypothetical protein
MQYIHLMFIFKLQRPIHPIQINIDKWILMKKPSYPSNKFNIFNRKDELIKIE